MADTADDLMAGAMASGYRGLSTRQCWMALLAIYAGGISMQDMIDGAAAAGYHTLSTRQLKQCLLVALQ